MPLASSSGHNILTHTYTMQVQLSQNTHKSNVWQSWLDKREAQNKNGPTNHVTMLHKMHMSLI